MKKSETSDNTPIKSYLANMGHKGPKQDGNRASNLLLCYIFLPEPEKNIETSAVDSTGSRSGAPHREVCMNKFPHDSVKQLSRIPPGWEGVHGEVADCCIPVPRAPSGRPRTHTSEQEPRAPSAKSVCLARISMPRSKVPFRLPSLAMPTSPVATPATPPCSWTSRSRYSANDRALQLHVRRRLPAGSPYAVWSLVGKWKVLV